MKKLMKVEATSVIKPIVGEVVSDKMDKTVVIRVVRTFKHPLYGKVIKRAKKYKVHDEQNVAKIGDMIEAIECRPLSKSKHMILKRVVINIEFIYCISW